MEIVITIIVIIILISLIKAIFAFIAENWKPILIIIGSLALIALIITCIVVPEHMYGVIIAFGGILIVGGVASGVVAILNILHNNEVDRFYRVVQKCADYLLCIIQQNCAISDFEVREEISNSKLYSMNHAFKAIEKLLNERKIIRKKLNKTDSLYVNNTPLGEKMETIEINLD